MLFPNTGYGFEDFVEKTGQVHSRERLFEILTETMADYGFDRVNFSVQQDDEVPAADQGFGIISTYPRNWQRRYREQGFVKIDPVLRCATSTFRPFRWRDLERTLHLSYRQIRFFRQAEDAGLYNGIGIPFRGPRTQIAGIALATSSRTALHLTNLDLVTAFCNQFYTVFKRVVAKPSALPPPVIPLSSRETEILRWVAHGKSDEQISNLLAISANTVDFHLRNVFRKLDVNNRVAAAVVGLSRGIIEF